jgi:hypothetical protein
LTPEEKQSELQRHRAILLATLDYLAERLGGSIVYDQYDPFTEFYQQQKIQTEKYFKQRRLDRLQQRLTSLTKGLQHRADLRYAKYIKEKTGYTIDIFEDLRRRVAAIVSQNEIRSDEELNDIGAMLRFFHETSVNEEGVEKLKAMLANYSNQRPESSYKRNEEYSEVISRVEKDCIEEVTVRISTGPKPKHFEEQWVTSPDGKRKLRVAQWSDGKHASTYVAVEFPAASGAVYGMSGIYPDVKAWWKDNSTIVVETKKEYTANVQHKLIRSFDDVISIEYIEH